MAFSHSYISCPFPFLHVDWNLILDMQGGPNHARNYCDAVSELQFGLPFFLLSPLTQSSSSHGWTKTQPILADVDKQEIHIQPQFYFMCHFSKCLRPQSIVVDTNVRESANHHTTSSPLVCVAAKTPDRRGMVAVVQNTGDEAISFRLHVSTGKDASAQESELIQIPPHAIQTLRWAEVIA